MRVGVGVGVGVDADADAARHGWMLRPRNKELRLIVCRMLRTMVGVCLASAQVVFARLPLCVSACVCVSLSGGHRLRGNPTSITGSASNTHSV